MKNFLYTSFFIFLFSTVIGNAEQLRPEHDLTYLGAFRVPTDSGSNYSWAWNTKNTLVFNPASGTLIAPPMVVGGHANFLKTTEFSIPTPVVSSSKSLADLNVASTVHGWSDMTGGLWDIGADSANLSYTYLPAQGSQSKNKLYWVTSSWYNPPSAGTATLGMSDLDFATSNAKGPWKIYDTTTSTYPAASRTSRYIFTIPDSWSSVHLPGYKLASGENKINNGGTLGACIYAIKPWTTDSPLSAGSNIEAKVLLAPGDDSDSQHRRGYTGSLFDKYSWNDGFYSAAWVEVGDRAAIIFTGNVATLPASSYGDCDSETEICQYYKNELPGDSAQVINPILSCAGGTCDRSPDACSTGDVRSEPYYRVLWLYDPDDLAAVASGTKQPYEPQPYAVYNLEKYMFRKTACVQNTVGGIAYDSGNKKIYITELMADSTISSSDLMPIIHVFQLSDTGSLADTKAPTPIDSVVHNGTGGLTWEASTDDTDIGGYMVYRNGKPIAFTPTNSWQDSVYNRFIGAPNHTYTIDAVDSVNNSIMRGQLSWRSGYLRLPSGTATQTTGTGRFIQ